MILHVDYITASFFKNIGPVFFLKGKGEFSKQTYQRLSNDSANLDNIPKEHFMKLEEIEVNRKRKRNSTAAVTLSAPPKATAVGSSEVPVSIRQVNDDSDDENMTKTEDVRTTERLQASTAATPKKKKLNSHTSIWQRKGIGNYNSFFCIQCVF